MPTYSVFVPFRKRRLALRRKIASLQDAISFAEGHGASSVGRAATAFIVVDGTGETLSLEAGHEVLGRQRETFLAERLERVQRSAARVTERALQARERAIVAC